jgi:lysophospholipase L1-like esterase
MSTKKNSKTKIMKKKTRSNIKFAIAIGIVAMVTGIKVWSLWFGKDNPETGLQYVATLAGSGKTETGATNSVMFLGDSITAREDWNVLFGVSHIINAGISGNTTDDVLGRMDPLLESKPRKIFLMIGINDLLRGKDVPYILENYKKIVNQIKLESPDSEVYIQSVLPINNDITKYGKVDSRKIIALNYQLNLLAEENGKIFINLYPYFCGFDNKLYAKYTSDGVHPNAYGYAAWKDLISPYAK